MFSSKNTMNLHIDRKVGFLGISTLFFFLFILQAHAAVTCGSTCISTSKVTLEASGGDCLFIYNNEVYKPPASSISGGMHKGAHYCGADVTGKMATTHTGSPSTYLTPYKCATLCAPCADGDADGYGATSCGGDDCNDNNKAVHPGATDVCDGLDNNCNSQIDEGLTTRNANCGVGACQVSASQTCTAGNWTPICTPKEPAAAEVCDNGIDDNCDGQIDEGCACIPGRALACGKTIGICKQGAQTCGADKSWGPCLGETLPFSGELCGNNLDDDCNGIIDEGCEFFNSSLYTQPILPPAPKFDVKIKSCVPVCVEHCGQNNGCGGICSSDQKLAWSKCGNPACTPDCKESCGQNDGCGGKCTSAQLGACGVCGNPQCCIDTELCGDGLDNNCNGQVDESCNVFMRLVGRAPPKAEIVTNPDIIDMIGLGVVLAEKSSMLIRISGIIAFFFAGLTLLIGIYRFKLIKLFSRAEVIKYHALVGFFSLFFLGLHIIAAIMDVPGFGDTVHWRHVFLPIFDGVILTGVAWGVIGMYLLLITILTGIFFIKMARKVGYKLWLFLHRLSFAFYAFIFYHAIAIGSDFANWYVRIFFGHVIILIVVFVLMRTYNNKKVVDKVKTLAITIGLHPSTAGIEDILYNPEYVGKRVTTKGTISKVPSQQGVVEEWWFIHNDSDSLFALMPDGTQPDEYTEITGDVRKVGPHLYLEVAKLKK